MNEGDPTFGSATYTVSVPEDTAANSEVVLLDVTDTDDGSDGKTVFRGQLKIILVDIGDTYDGTEGKTCLKESVQDYMVDVSDNSNG